MTTLDAQIKLLSWFSNNNSFSIEDDLNKIPELPKDNLDRIEAAFECALNQLEKNELVNASQRQIKDGKSYKLKEIWVLNTSLNQFNQDISCSINAASKISDVINQFSQLMGSDNDKQSDPGNLGEDDLLMLLYIIEVMANRLKELENSNKPQKIK